MSGPTYAQFHFAFVLPAVAGLLAAATVTRSRTTRPTVWSIDRPYWSGVAIVTLLAVVYTTPWDNYLIARGVWGYGEGRTFVHLGFAPLGEYVFFVLQPILTALWLGQLTLRDGWPEADALGRTTHGRRTLDVGRLSLRYRGVGALAATGLGIAGAVCLRSPETLYLGAILAWGAPVLFIQWVVGLPQLLYQRRTAALGVAVPTLYLWVIDRVALATGIWHISPTYTTGVALVGLPLEEALFFLVTNLFVVQGLVLFRWVVDRWA
ncbi:lycopene cyclase domain-containing protein [Halomarina ordinaria]|uniref:Lycopene cyclase domain-containing protein n=1 Tax=Halomarina ordinaria TaxID=3033939 RepID=A0ABD5U8M2_9EURY|nr:lycopene cyclase domain-containing protein [Halomarina sp. PSRA2]